MALRGSRPKVVEINSFDPSLLSIEENRFLLEGLGKPTLVALQNMPREVNPRAVKPILDRTNELESMKTHYGNQWVGFEALRESIRAFLRETDKWERDARRSKRAPRYPSLYSFDQKGRAHLGGIGSDSGRIKTYFDAKGNRVPFEVDLIPDNETPWDAPGFTEAPVSGGLKVDDANNRIECLVCGYTASYKGESRTSYAAARARMSKHLRGAKDNVEQHRLVHSQEFS